MSLAALERLYLTTKLYAFFVIATKAMSWSMGYASARMASFLMEANVLNFAEMEGSL